MLAISGGVGKFTSNPVPPCASKDFGDIVPVGADTISPKFDVKSMLIGLFTICAGFVIGCCHTALLVKTLWCTEADCISDPSSCMFAGLFVLIADGEESSMAFSWGWAKVIWFSKP